MASETASERATAGGAALVWCAAAAALVIWGATPMITRVAVLEIEPSAVGILRTILAAVLALPLAIALRLARPHGAREWTQLAVSALGGFVLFPVMFGLGVRYTSAALYGTHCGCRGAARTEPDLVARRGSRLCGRGGAGVFPWRLR